MLGSSRVRFAAPILFVAFALSGCGGGGRALPPAAPTAHNVTQSAFAVPPPPVSMAPPRRPSFIDTVPKAPSSAKNGIRPLDVVPHPAFFSGENALANGVYYLALPNTNIFGYYSYLPDSHYIFHFDMGYEYLIDANDGQGGVYMYDFASTHWWYTSRSYPFPYLYDFTLNALLYYYPDTSNPQHYTTSPRFFYDFTHGGIVTVPSALPAPAVGYLGPASAGSVDGILSNVSTGVTFVGISQALVQGGPSTTVPTIPISITYGPTVLSARRAPQNVAVAPAPRGMIDGPLEDPHEYRALLAKLRRVAGAAPSSVRRTRSLGITVGATTSFWVNTFGIGSSGGAYVQRSATLRKVTPNGYIWIDDSLWTSAGGPVNDSVAQAIADDFDNGYVSDTTHYGTANYSARSAGMLGGQYQACDVNGTALAGQTVPFYIVPTDGKVVVFVADTVGLGSGVGGYFSAANYLYQTALNCLIGHNGYTVDNVPQSNEAPMIVVGYNSSSSPAFETGEDLLRGTAHEFQHEINFVNHAILNPGQAGEDTWINEGMSMLAQDLAARRMYPSLATDVDDALARARQFLAAPQNFSLTAFTGRNSQGVQSYNCSGCYGEEYLFQRYLYDRFGGDAYLHKMLGTSVSFENVQQATGIDPGQAISDFGLALAASGTNATSDPRYGFNGLSMHGAYDDQSGNNTIVLTGPATVPLGSGTSSYLLGSLFFLSGDATAQGKTIDAKDASGTFMLRAGVVQH